MFWIAAALMTAAVVAVLVTPLVRGGLRQRRAADHDLAVYRDQLAEVERSHAAGLLDDQEAESARTEIGRRILNADRRRQGSTAPRPAPGSRRAAAVVVATLVPAAALGLYLDLGAPGMPDRPLTAREDVGGERGLAKAGGASGQLIETERKLQARLEKHPKDAAAWRRLGEVRMRRERFGEAARALKQALEVGAGPATRALYGEALVMAEGGTVSEAARKAFERARAEGGPMPRAAFYLALHKLQQGQPRAALDAWARLARRAGSDAPWMASVRQQMRTAEKRLGIEPGSTFARVAGEDGSQSAGPTRGQMRAAQDMSPAQRQKMIRGMVERLATRLENNPEDLAGWKRLARSYTVLGKHAKARDALAKAVELAPKDVDLLARYARALQRSGKPGKAVAVSRRMLDLAPKHPQALWFVAMEAAAKGEREKARRLFNQALEQLPDDAPQLAELRKRVEQLLKSNSRSQDTH